jgi:hypothetical protein
MWQKLKLALMATLTGSVLGGLVLMWAYPALRAAAFPERMGLVTLAPGIAADSEFTLPERAQLLDNIALARARVAAFYGAFDANVKLVACKTESCEARLSGRVPGTAGAAAMAYGTPGVSVLYLSARGLTPTIIAHEFSHAELARITGLGASLTGAVPAWVNEGLAVIVSDDPRYLGPGTGPARCLAPPVDLVTGLAEFRRAGAQDEMLYARAACGVLHWMAGNGGRRGLLAGLRAIGAGQSSGQPFPLASAPG